MELDLATAIALCLEERSRMKGVLKFIRNRVRKGRSKGRIRMAKGEDKSRKKNIYGKKRNFPSGSRTEKRRKFVASHLVLNA